MPLRHNRIKSLTNNALHRDRQGLKYVSPIDRMKKWFVLVLTIALGSAGYYGWTRWQQARLSASAPTRPTTARAEVRDIDFAVNAAGEIGPAEQVSVRPEINGKIEQLPVDIGDRVKKGDLFFKLDDKELQQQRASNLTDIERARLSPEKAERDYKRAQELLAEKLISQELARRHQDHL